MAARTNSSWAPRGPRSRSRPSLRMRFKCANRISIFLRSHRDRSKPSVPANDRATSRACSLGVSKKCRSLVRSGPLCRGIGWRDELRDNVAGGAPCLIVEGRQILLHCAAGPSRITIPMPILTCDRALLVGIGLDQARIDGKAFATNQVGRNAPLDHPFEHTTENVSLAEALVAGA